MLDPSSTAMATGTTTYTHLAQLRIIITPTLEHVYAALNILSIVLLSILLSTIIFSKRLKRDSTLLNAFVVIIAVDLINILYYLVRGGHPLDDDDLVGGIPAEGVCRAQACLLAGSQAAQASAVFAVCLQVSSCAIARWGRRLLTEPVVMDQPHAAREGFLL